MTIRSKDIESVVDGLLKARDNELTAVFGGIADHQCIKDAIEAINKAEPEEFYYRLVYQMNEIIEATIKSATDKPEAIFLLENTLFVERHFKEIIEKYEGLTCVSDKTGTILRKILNFYLSDTVINFDYNQEYTFHLPTTVFTTHDEIIRFFTALRLMYHGKPGKYIEAIVSMTNKYHQR